MLENYNDYLEKIKRASLEIPDQNLLFWGMWHCDRLYKIGKDCFNDYFSDEHKNLIQDIMDYFRVFKDQQEKENSEMLNHYFESLEEVDESDLDQLDYQENALYELVCSLDILLNYCINKVRGFEYTITQAMMNVIDSKLQEGNVDILTFEGFRSTICQEEITLQFQMIDKLKVVKNLEAF